MSGDNKSLSNPLKIQEEDKQESPSSETEGQSAQENTFSGENSSVANTTSKSDASNEPVASSEGVKIKENIQEDASTSGYTKEFQEKSSDADTSTCTKPSEENVPERNSSESADEKEKKKTDGVLTQIEKESQDVGSDKEKKSTEEPKRESKDTDFKKGKGKTQKEDLLEEGNEEVSKDEPQEQSESRENEVTDERGATATKVDKTKNSKASNKKPEKGTYSEKKKREEKRKRKSQAIGSSKKGNEDTIEGDKETKPKEKKPKEKNSKKDTGNVCSKGENSKSNAEPTGTSEHEQQKRNEMKETESASEESQNRQDKDKSRKKQREKAPKTEDKKTIVSVFPKGNSKEKPLGETDGHSGVEQHDKQSEDAGNSKQDCSRDSTESAVENTQHQQLAQDPQLEQSTPEGPDSSGLSVEEKVMLPAPRMGRMEAFKGFISRHLNLGDKCKDQQKLPSDSIGKDTDRAQESEATITDSQVGKEQRVGEQNQEDGNKRASEQDAKIEAGDDKGGAKQKSEEDKNKAGKEATAMRDVVFHLFTHQTVTSVMLEFINPPSNISKVLLLQQANDSGLYWKSPLLQFPVKGNRNIEYCYTLHCDKPLKVEHPNQVSVTINKESLKEKYNRYVHWGTNQYDVFHQPGNKNVMQSLFNGQFYFVQLIYLQFVNGELGVDRVLEEYDSLAFGHPQFRYQERVQLYNWVISLRSESLNCYRSLFICYLLYSFYYRAKCTVQEQYIVGEVADKLMDSMSTWKREEFDLLVHKDIKRIIQETISYLVAVGTAWGWLPFCAWFCHLFDAEFVLQITMYLEGAQKDKKPTNEGLENCVNIALPKLENLKNSGDRERYVKFLVKRAQSVPILWRLYSWCQEKFPTLAKQEIKLFGKTFRKLIGHDRHLKQEIFDVQVWSGVPEALRDELADPFIKSLVARLPEVRKWNQERLHALWKVMVDAKLQKCEDFMKIVQHFAISSSKELHDFTFELLNTHEFAEYWKTVDGDARCKLLHKLLRAAIGFEARGDCGESKNRVLRTLRAVSAIFKTLQATPCPAFVDSLHENVMSNLQASETADVINAFVEVQGLSKETKENYDRLLQFVINRDVENRSLLPTLKQMLESPGESSAEMSEVDELKIARISEEAILSLLRHTRLPPDSEVSAKGEYEEVFDNLSKDEELWIFLLSTPNPSEKVKEDPRFAIVAQALAAFLADAEAKQLKLGFLQKLLANVNSISLLTKFCASFQLCKSHQGPKVFFEEEEVKALISSNVAELDRLHNIICDLEKAVKFLQRLRGVEILDTENVVESISKKKKELPNTLVADILNEEYWGDLEPLLQNAELLAELFQSRIFQSAAASCLLEEQEDCYSVEDALEILSENGIEVFNKLCGPLFGRVDSLYIHNTESLMKAIGTEDELMKELTFVSQQFEDGVSSEVEDMLKCYIKYPVIQKKVQKLEVILKAFGYETWQDLNWTLKVQALSSRSRNSYSTLARLSDAVKSVTQIDATLSEDLTNIVSELADSRDLVDLLQETAHDDVVIFIDAVEEHSDQTVSESEVSDFIEVHRFLSPLVQDPPDNPEEFLDKLKQRFGSLEKRVGTGMAAKIKACSCSVHSLRNLYKNLANRGEMTKEIIANALSKGRYQIETNVRTQASGANWQFKLIYEDREDCDRTYNMADLHDFRSRALLIVNSETKQKSLAAAGITRESSNVDLQEFINQVDLLSEIARTGEELQSSGHPKFKLYWAKLEGTDQIESLAKQLETELQSWEELLTNVRNQKYYLNYFHPDQLWSLEKFFDGDTADENIQVVHSLFRYIDPTINVEDLDEFRGCNKKRTKEGAIESKLVSVGILLDEIFNAQEASDEDQGVSLLRGSPVKPGEVYVAVLDQNSTQTVPVVMSLFNTTTGSFPQPNQILFCHVVTSWDEINLLLRRCFNAHAHSKSCQLHCLANVESLPYDLQFQLVDAIKYYEANSDAPYLLSLICRGGEHHPVSNQFPRSKGRLPGMTDAELRQHFRTLCPAVTMVTSDLPGLGKTEVIYEKSAEQEKAIVSFSISGPLSRGQLVQKLISLDLREFHCLHLDIAEVDDSLLLDTFLFELIVVGMVASETQLFHVPTRFIFIEVANTLQHWLRDSLTVSKCFNRVHEEWDGYRNLVSSNERASQLQIVCHYLDAYEKRILESETLSLQQLKQRQPLSDTRCKQLLKTHFRPNSDLSFNILDSFIGVLADQLRKFSSSPFFRPENLKDMIGGSHDIRTRLFEALLDVSREFASRSVDACKAVQAKAMGDRADTELHSRNQMNHGRNAGDMVDRVTGMIQWADSNHLVVMFHTLDAHSVTALFRRLSQVPAKVKEVFKSQETLSGEKLQELQQLTQDQLRTKLERIVRTTRNSDGNPGDQSYVLTADNVLKMVLIIQRIRAGIPVIVMGETGCGKTSLIRYLAKMCDVSFHVQNFHAGITEDDIVKFVREQKKEAEGNPDDQIWVFLDEINTCEHLGIINDVICHRSLFGIALPPNLVFMAACNPYRLRPQGTITTAGLSGKSTTDEYSKLVYRVHPLPETMIDYVWDYGALNAEDEQAYISQMAEDVANHNIRDLMVDLLVRSQEFIRNEDKSRYCVSLRDVRRCIVLAEWFRRVLQKRTALPEDGRQKLDERAKDCYEKARTIDVDTRSVVLALAHSYQSRIPTSETRLEYREMLSLTFQKHGRMKINEDVISKIVRAEQEEYLARMELPEGTARNAALRENVFVILVCILNRLPVFVVGKPGCSKSLSMQVIRSNLRGRDSKDDFFKSLPQLYIVSYQGSESSTSEGILKVFDKACKYKKHNSADKVLPVVLLDEIGLAEISTYNPLKVLHRLLEPELSEFPEVAVVGISNWALDAAKMNRAIHLSRPEPTLEDLHETGLSIRHAQTKEDNFLETRSGKRYLRPLYSEDNQLRCLAEAYYEYQAKQLRENFHGLRDYYSLIKSLSLADDITDDISRQNVTSQDDVTRTYRVLQRNFGGLPKDNQTLNIKKVFTEKASKKEVVEEPQPFPVTDLIRDNLRDKLARHLMLITSGDSAMGIVQLTLQDLDKDKITIFGSKFEEDQSEDYNYRILSRIILYMEKDCVLILKDLESVYGSLYDMLNQNYTVVGGKKNCRVALGPYSNPMCQVHDGFRCIVLIDEGKVDYADPPFLNRFEKQLLRFSDVLTEDQQEVVSSLKTWVHSFSTGAELPSQLDERDVFLGFHEDTLPSLVLNEGARVLSRDNLLKKCKAELMQVATPDGVLRSLKSELASTEMVEISRLYKTYFGKPIHNGLRDFIEFSVKQNRRMEQNNEEGVNDTVGQKLLVMTHANIHTDVTKCLDGFIQCQSERLSAFKSEKQLTKQIQNFWREPESELLVIQCCAEIDADHMLLMKSTIDNHREDYIKSTKNKNQRSGKHVCIVVHVERQEERSIVKGHSWQFNFLSGWKQATVDTLEPPPVAIASLLDKSVPSLLADETLQFPKIAADQLLWCFTRLKYPLQKEPSLEETMELISKIKSSKSTMSLLEKLVLQCIQKDEDTTNAEEGLESFVDTPKVRSWQVRVACDQKALLTSSTLVAAMLHHVIHLVQCPLAKVVYSIENGLTWNSCLDALEQVEQDSSSRRSMRSVWAELLCDKQMFSVDEIPDPQGAQSYIVSRSACHSQYPFSSTFCRKIESTRDRFAKEGRRLELQEENVDEEGELTDEAVGCLLEKFSAIIETKVPQMLEKESLRENIMLYIEDTFDAKSAEFSQLSRDDRISLLKAACNEYMKLETHGDITLTLMQLHYILWQHETAVMGVLQLVASSLNFFQLDIKGLTNAFVKSFDAKCLEDKESPPNSLFQRRVWEQVARESNSLSSTDEHRKVTTRVCGKNDTEAEEEEEDTEGTEEDSADDNETDEEERDESDDVDEGESSDEDSDVDNDDDDDDGDDDRDDDSDDDEEEDEEEEEEEENDNEDKDESEDGDCSSHDKKAREEDGDDDEDEDGQNDEDNDGERKISEEEDVEEEDNEHQENTKQETEDDSSKEKETKRYLSENQSDVSDHDEQSHFDTLQKRHHEDDDNVASTEVRSFGLQDKEDRVKQQEEGKGVPQVLEQSFEEQIVDTCCTKLYPTDKVMTMLGNPATWQRATSVIISMVTKLRLQQPPSFHFLRVCEDFANIVYSHSPTEVYTLYVLGASALTLAEDCFWDSQEFFDSICELVEGQQDKEVEDGRRWQEFLVHFFLRCISANPDTPLLGGMMRKLCSVTDKELLKYASPVLHRILMAEESETFEAVLDNADAMQDCPNLQSIDQALNSVIIENQPLPLDCHFCVMCCDIIGQVAFQDLRLALVAKSNDPVVERMHMAISLVSDINHSTSMFQFLVAVAYLRAFLSSVAAAILQDASCLQRDGDLSMLFRNVSAILDTPTLDKCKNPRKSVFTLFFLRELRKTVSMFELRELCDSATIMPVLKPIPWARQGLLVAFSSSKNTDKMTAEAALVDLVKRNNKEKMTKFCSSLRSSASIRKSFAVILIEKFYLPRAIRNIGDTEDKAVEVIMKELPKLPLPFKTLLGCVSGKEDFQVPGLKISPESPAGSVQRAALILHLATLQTAEFAGSKSSESPFLSLIQQPENCSGSFMPGAPNTRTTDGQRNFLLCGPEILNGVSLFHCTCAILYATTSPDCHCSRCKSKCAPLHDTEPVSSQAAIRGYVPIHVSQISNDSFRVRDMTPVSFRVLHLFVHSALYVGVALKMFSVSHLAQFLALENTGEDAAQECFLHIVNDLDVLCRLLAWSEERVINWLHRVLEETSQHMAHCRIDVACRTNQSREQWEATFTDKVEAMLRETATRTQEASNEKEMSDCSGSIEDQIEEKDYWGVAVDTTQRNLYIPRLFRATKPKSLEDLKAQYYLATEEQKRSHPLLGLFLDNLTTLPYVSELYSLINWSRMLEASLSHRLSRNGAEKTTIEDVIRDEHAPNDAAESGRSRREDAFTKFKASWQKVKHLVQRKLGPAENVPYVNELSPVSVCLVDRKGSGRHLYTALQILQKMQNEFQEKVLELATKFDCAALDFLKRSDGLSSLAVIRLQDVREKEVICYQWTNDILFHSHHDTDYGHGKEIIYDFGKIERELAGRFLLGKVYFSATEELREFTYSKELFHTCANVLNELGAYVRQEPLTDSHRSGLDRLKKGSLKTVQDLLEHLEVVVCLMKTTGASDNTTPLEDYTDRWLSSSRPFPKVLLPEPSKEFQLRHVVALYEGLEDLLAEPAADTLHDTYRISLPHDPKMITECSNANEESALGAVVTALRRFIFRYLLSDKFQVDPAKNAVWYFRDPSLWPMDTEGPDGAATSCDETTSSLVQRARKFLPEDLVAGRVYTLMKYYRDILKTQEEKRAHTRGLSALGRKTGFRPQKKRKLAIIFG